MIARFTEQRVQDCAQVTMELCKESRAIANVFQISDRRPRLHQSGNRESRSLDNLVTHEIDNRVSPNPLDRGKDIRLTHAETIRNYFFGNGDLVVPGWQGATE